MHLLICGGYSDYNKKWVEDVQKTLGGLFDSSEILYYKHWSPYDENADIKPEVENIKKIIGGKKDVVVFGKSAGASLILQAIRNDYIQPVKCVFVGFPYEWSIEQGWDMDDLLGNLNIPTLFLQQSQDLSTPFSKVQEVLKKLAVKNYELVELPGSDHQYADMQELRQYVEPFIKKSIQN